MTVVEYENWMYWWAHGPSGILKGKVNEYNISNFIDIEPDLRDKIQHEAIICYNMKDTSYNARHVDTV